MKDIAISKEHLRQYIRNIQKQYTQEELAQLSNSILTHLETEPHFQNGKTILLYYSLPNEVQTDAFIEKWAKFKQILLPKVTGDELTIYPYQGKECLQCGAFGIMEPQGVPFESYDKIDAAVIPGMAFDVKGNRLGRGKAYYDRFLKKLANCPTYFIGVAFPFQILKEIPTESTDIKMDAVIS